MKTLWLRITLVTACILVASIAVAALLVFLGMISYLALREATTPAFAAAMTVFGGLVLVATALTGVYIALGVERCAKPAKAAVGSSARDDAILSEIAGVLGGDLAQMIHAKPYAAAVAALAAGFAIGSVPELRSGLSSLLVKR